MIDCYFSDRSIQDIMYSTRYFDKQLSTLGRRCTIVMHMFRVCWAVHTLALINYPLTAGDAYIRVFIFY